MITTGKIGFIMLFPTVTYGIGAIVSGQVCDKKVGFFIFLETQFSVIAFCHVVPLTCRFKTR